MHRAAGRGPRGAVVLGLAEVDELPLAVDALGHAAQHRCRPRRVAAVRHPERREYLRREVVLPGSVSRALQRPAEQRDAEVRVVRLRELRREHGHPADPFQDLRLRRALRLLPRQAGDVHGEGAQGDAAARGVGGLDRELREQVADWRVEPERPELAVVPQLEQHGSCKRFGDRSYLDAGGGGEGDLAVELGRALEGLEDDAPALGHDDAG